MYVNVTENESTALRKRELIQLIRHFDFQFWKAKILDDGI